MAVILKHLCLSTATPGSTSHIASKKEKCEELSSPKATLHGVYLFLSDECESDSVGAFICVKGRENGRCTRCLRASDLTRASQEPVLSLRRSINIYIRMLRSHLHTFFLLLLNNEVDTILCECVRLLVHYLLGKALHADVSLEDETSSFDT